MTIEKSLERIADALESLVQKPSVTIREQETTTSANTAMQQPDTPPPVDKEYTIQDVQTFLIEYSKKHNEKKAVALLVKHGANKTKPTIKSLPVENYAALIQEK